MEKSVIRNAMTQGFSGRRQAVASRPFNVFFFFSTFEMDQLGKIRQNHWKERLLTDFHDCNKLHETNML